MDVEGRRRVTIQEASRIMGVSEGAIRKRVKRATLDHDKAPDGRIYVYLPGTTRGIDERLDEVPHPNSEALISQLREENAYLRDENRRKDEIIMQQALTVRQLTAAPPQEPSEAPGGPETATEGAGRGEVPTDQQEPAERRSWWRRLWEG